MEILTAVAEQLVTAVRGRRRPVAASRFVDTHFRRHAKDLTHLFPFFTTPTPASFSMSSQEMKNGARDAGVD
ncbi:MAG: hypothetical protein AB1689_07230 [Thermodesulfobacteriota bacterium]